MASPELTVNIDHNSAEPIYRQLIRTIRMQIESGELPAGARLPASRELARQLSISRISVVNAYAELSADGYLDAHAGRGTYVANDATLPVSTQPTPAAQTESSHDYSLRDMMRLAGRPGIINFSHGSPPPDFFPVSAVKQALNYVLDRDGPEALSYEVSEGYMPLRVAVRDYVNAFGIQTHVNNVLITAGAQQGIDLVIQALLNEGDTLVTSSPTYIGVVDVARTRRVQVHTIPTDKTGIRIDCLENYLLEHSPNLIYVMPTFQNPTGEVMPIHHRRRIVNLAAEHNVPVVEDAVYHEFRFEGDNLPPLKSMDETGSVIHISAFTKTLLPGMRIGYLIADSPYYDRIARVKASADLSTSTLNQRAIHLMIENGILAQQLERNTRELRRRRDAALKAAARYFPKGTRWNSPEGGLYLWVKLPPNGPTAAELFIAAVQRDVAFAIGNLFFMNGGGSYYMRLNYGLQVPEKINEGFRRIGEAWVQLAQDYQGIEKPPLM